MKIIALLPFKNEASFLPTYLSSVSQIADAIVTIDDDSTDQSAELVRNAGGTVFTNSEVVASGWAEEHFVRQNLLQLGREAGGTHFICLDADEAFTTPFLADARSRIAALKPGHKLSLQWLALWKSVSCYRDDESVWSNNFKDVIFCDSPELSHDYAFLAVGRTPGPNTVDRTTVLPADQGAVLHFQFVFWHAFQVKQAWYRCSELIHRPGAELAINQKYAITLDDPAARTTPLPETWIKGITIPVDPGNLTTGWRIDEIYSWFQQYGVAYFEKLEIWQVPELHDRFLHDTGREPRPARSSFGQRVRHIVRQKISNRIHRHE